MLKIGYLTSLNPYDRNSFSGTNYYMYGALSHLVEVDLKLLGKSYLTEPKFTFRLIRKLKQKLNNKSTLYTKLSKLELNWQIQNIQDDLQKSEFDFIVAPVASHLIAELSKQEQTVPILFTTDATPKFLSCFYKWNLLPSQFEIEKKAISYSSSVIYSSDFMAELARTEYKELLNGSNDKIGVVPFGLNMDSVPITIKEKELNGSIKLVFCGQDWIRKGGKKALAAQQELLNRGTKAELTIIGCNPEEAHNKPGITVIPFLNKNVPEQQQQYFDILTNSHFLVLPTLADCTPMVIAEANAFGSPVIVSNVGGIPTLVKHDINGLMLDEHATGADYADAISEIFNNETKYKEMSKLSRKTYEDRLNWSAWAKEICSIGQNLTL